MKAQDPKKKAIPDTPTRCKESLRPPMNKNLKPFPSTSFSFNIMTNSRSSHTNSMRDDDH